MVKYIFSILILSYSTLVVAENSASMMTGNVREAQATIIKDPTQPLFYKVKSVTKKSYRQRLPVLQSIVLNNKKRRAIMNNKYYEVGQKVNGYKISRIEKKVVYLVYHSKTYPISLYSDAERFGQ